MSRSLRFFTIVVILGSLTLGVFLWPYVREARAKAAFEGSLESRDDASFHAPRRSTLEAATRWSDYILLGNPRYRIYRKQFLTFFSRPVESVRFYRFTGFRGGSGSVLAGFANLKKFTLLENTGEPPTEAALTLLCQELRSVPRLEVIQLSGKHVTDAAIAALANHPKVQAISILRCDITPASLGTFASMPSLKRLEIDLPLDRISSKFTPEEKKAMQAALPSVTLTFR